MTLHLPSKMFISKIQLYESHFYHNNSHFQVQVVLHNDNDSNFKCSRNVKRAGLVFYCEPPVKSNIVQVSMEGNFTLALCDVFISGIGENLSFIFH